MLLGVASDFMSIYGNLKWLIRFWIPFEGFIFFFGIFFFNAARSDFGKLIFDNLSLAAVARFERILPKFCIVRNSIAFCKIDCNQVAFNWIGVFTKARIFHRGCQKCWDPENFGRKVLTCYFVFYSIYFYVQLL